jgi:hypothetical protein
MCCLLAAVTLGSAPLTAVAQPCSTPTECGQHAQETDSVSLELRLGWRVIGAIKLDAAGQLDFPEVSAVPGIYRFDLRTKDGRALYIGETKNLRQRFYHYRRPGKTQPTNHRICAEMRRAPASGGSVEVSLAENARFCAAAKCDKADLASANHRRLFEQLAILSLAPDVRMLNRDGIRASKSREFSFCS